ncbi:MULTISPECIES: hypothetical protein [Myroides]|nr:MULTISPECIES: hypothetical protein [Myroides]MCS7473372.1 hypothetical protein [Myroides odoratimimus]
MSEVLAVKVGTVHVFTYVVSILDKGVREYEYLLYNHNLIESV